MLWETHPASQASIRGVWPLLERAFMTSLTYRPIVMTVIVCSFKASSPSYSSATGALAADCSASSRASKTSLSPLAAKQQDSSIANSFHRLALPEVLSSLQAQHP